MQQLNCQAVITDKNGHTDTRQFVDQTTAAAWILSKVPMYGNPTPTVIAPENAIPSNAISNSPLMTSKRNDDGTFSQVQAANSDGEPLVVCVMPPEYTVAYTDITAQAAIEANQVKGLASQSAGANMIALVYAINEANLGSGALTSQEFNAMLADVNLSNIERCLWNGSLVTAQALITANASSLSNYFSVAQLTQINTALAAAIANINT